MLLSPARHFFVYSEVSLEQVVTEKCKVVPVAFDFHLLSLAVFSPCSMGLQAAVAKGSENFKAQVSEFILLAHLFLGLSFFF